ncbi:MAG: DUF1579 domain-containing protein [Phycisphaeraceae bacterium]|nr:DUF1579 domain-containing protein [Phycisphaeraceae bacterium]MCW5755070.1 DUF1579 domain-containing protein [Phycisphaeraceae bacterium]
MRKLVLCGITLALFACGAFARSPRLPHDQEWLRQLVGEWDAKFNVYMQPGQPPTEAPGTDTVRTLGEYWVISESTTSMMGVSFSGILSLGYDPQKKHFAGTWVDSMGGYLWVYTGTLNDAGDTLTLNTQGPSMQDPDMTAHYQEVIRITGDDTRTFTSSVRMEDGSWTKILTIEYRRKASRQPGEDRAQTGQHLAEPQQAEKPMYVHYLEIVTPTVDKTCEVLAKATGVTFGKPIAELGNARIAKLKNGGQIGVRAPMHQAEDPVVRPYLLVEDIRTAIAAAEAAGAQVAVPPMEIPGHGTIAIYFLDGIQHGFWQR